MAINSGATDAYRGGKGGTCARYERDAGQVRSMVDQVTPRECLCVQGEPEWG